MVVRWCSVGCGLGRERATRCPSHADVLPMFAGLSANGVSADSSTLDWIHDLLFDTNLWSSNRRFDTEYKTDLVGKLCAWRGAATERKMGAATLRAPHKKDAAGKYLKFVRELEGRKPDMLKKVLQSPHMYCACTTPILCRMHMHCAYCDNCTARTVTTPLHVL